MWATALPVASDRMSAPIFAPAVSMEMSEL